VFNSQILEVAVGVSFIFALLSVFVSIINETIAGAKSLRAKDLEKTIRNLLSDGSNLPLNPFVLDHNSGLQMAVALLGHPLISNTGAPTVLGKGFSAPAYIDGKAFSSALLHLLNPTQIAGVTFTNLISSVSGLKNTELKNSLLPLIQTANGDVDKARKNIEDWFNQSMDRLNGLYKRRAQMFNFIIGLALAITLNVDAIHLTKALWNDQATRESLVKQAEIYQQTSSNKSAKEKSKQVQTKDADSKNDKANNPDYKQGNGAGAPATAQDSNDKKISTNEDTQSCDIDCAKKKLVQINELISGLSLPIGWQEDNKIVFTDFNLGSFLIMVLGWILTAVAITLGAPFWFDLMNQTLKLNVRFNGKHPDEKAAS